MRSPGWFIGVAVFTVFVAIMVVIGIVWSLRSARRRRATFARVAAERGWAYTRERPELVDRFPGLPFGEGSMWGALNVVDGTSGGSSFVAYDYRFTYGGESPTVATLSVVAMGLGRRVPTLQVRPRPPFWALHTRRPPADLVTGEPAFDAQFVVTTNSPEFAADVLHEAMRALLLSMPERGWRFQDDSLVTFTPGRHDEAELDLALTAVHAVLDAVPARVWARVTGGSATSWDGGSPG